MGRNSKGRWCILWGGGLGDMLVIRPLLQALEVSGKPEPVFMTRSSIMPGLFDALKVRVHIVRLPKSPLSALRFVRSLGPFEQIYCGPHNTWRTRLLARAIPSENLWKSVKKSNTSFLADHIVADLVTAGLVQEKPRAYGTLPLFPVSDRTGFNLPQKPYLIIHPCAKEGWETTLWPVPRWTELLLRLRSSGLLIHLVGTPKEKEYLEKLWASPSTEGIHTHIGLQFWELEELIANARGVVCHNSGIMHIALAHSKPTVVITGSSGRQWRADYPWVCNVSSNACPLACNQYKCPIPGFSARCIRSLSVDHVYRACKTHLHI